MMRFTFIIYLYSFLLTALDGTGCEDRRLIYLIYGFCLGISLEWVSWFLYKVYMTRLGLTIAVVRFSRKLYVYIPLLPFII